MDSMMSNPDISRITMMTMPPSGQRSEIRNSLVLVEEPSGRIIDVLDRSLPGGTPVETEDETTASSSTFITGAKIPPTLSITFSDLDIRPPLSVGARNRARVPSFAGSEISLHTLRLGFRPDNTLTFSRSTRHRFGVGLGDDAGGEVLGDVLKGDRRRGTFATDVSRASFFMALDDQDHDISVSGRDGNSSTGEYDSDVTSAAGINPPSDVLLPQLSMNFSTQVLDLFWQAFFNVRILSAVDNIRKEVDSGVMAGGWGVLNLVRRWGGWISESYEAATDLVVGSLQTGSTAFRLVAPTTRITHSESLDVGPNHILSDPNIHDPTQICCIERGEPHGNVADPDMRDREGGSAQKPAEPGEPGLGIWYFDAEGIAKRVWSATTAAVEMQADLMRQTSDQQGGTGDARLEGLTSALGYGDGRTMRI